MIEEKPKKNTTILQIANSLSSMENTLERLCRNQTFAIWVFAIIMIVVLIQGQKISIKIPGFLEISSADPHE